MTANEIINQVKDLPTVSETARKLTRLLSETDSHRDELIRTIRCDNVITAKLLRACNSAASGMSNSIGSVDQAVLLLGDNAIYRMVVTIGFGAAMGFSLPGQAVEANGLWGHSLSTGMGAEYLTESEDYGDFQPSIAFTAGLLHDIGKLVLNQILTPKWRADIRSHISEDGCTRVEAEKKVLGADHAEVGACLLQRWRLPEVILEAVANHHSPSIHPVVQLSAVVYLANNAAHLAGPSPGGCDAFVLRPGPSVAELLGLKQERIEQMVANAHGAMKAANQFMSLV
jgi:putative nucleotidyltransferase with HDIG domain